MDLKTVLNLKKWQIHNTTIVIAAQRNDIIGIHLFPTENLKNTDSQSESTWAGACFRKQAQLYKRLRLVLQISQLMKWWKTVTVI